MTSNEIGDIVAVLIWLIVIIGAIVIVRRAPRGRTELADALAANTLACDANTAAVTKLTRQVESDGQ